MRDFLRRALLENALLKAISLALAIALFVFVRADKEAVSGVFFKVLYVYPTDRVLVSDTVPELRVSVRGPYARVNRLDEHALPPVRVDLRDAREGDLRFSEELIQLPAGMRVVSISPPSVKLHFEARAERTVPVQPVLEGEPAAGYRVVRSTAQPRVVQVSGARSVVDGIARAPTVALRIAETRETVRAQVELGPAPPHAEWRTRAPIAVEVTVEQALAERSLKQVAVRAVGASRLEARLEPEVAEVVLRGPAEALAQVVPGTPSLLVDVQAEDGKPPGAYRKRIGVVGLPSGIAAEVRPESVTVVTRRRRD